VVFDKTGTLTEGQPTVADVVATRADVSEADVFHIAASLERMSEHPLGHAIVRAAKERHIALAEVEGFENLAGKGIKGRLTNTAVAVGNVRLMREEGVLVELSLPDIETREARAQTAVAVARNRDLIGIIAIADTLKGDARDAVQYLHAEGIATAMITGDNAKTANAIAARIGIDEVFAEVLPQDKAGHVKRLQGRGQRVAFVGDGINDAPALAQADLGIAIGTGTDIAIEAGNIVLVKGSPLKVIEALRLSRLTFKTIRQNLFWAFVYNVAAIPLAAFGLLDPMIAAGAMAISSVSVVGNSLRIRRQKLV
jgi:P-type Cu+ transporter